MTRSRSGRRTRSILAVPPVVAADLVPGLNGADRIPRHRQRRISASTPPAGLAPIIGVVNGTVEWLFAFPDRLSVTISGADRLLDVPRETLARTLWQRGRRPHRPSQGAAAVADRARAPRHLRGDAGAECAERPGAATAWRNLVLAGDWTDTGLAGHHRRRDPLRQPRPPISRCGALRIVTHGLHDRRSVSARPEHLRPRRPLAAPDPEREHRGGDGALLALQQPRRPLVLRARGRRHHPGRIRAAAPFLRRAGRRLELEAKIAAYLRRIQGEHGGWPLFHDGAFDMSASVKAYFALKMIGDPVDAPHMRARARGDPVRAAARRAATSSPGCCSRSSATSPGARCR